MCFIWLLGAMNAVERKMLFIPLFIFLFFIFSSRIILQTQLWTYLIKLRWIGYIFLENINHEFVIGNPAHPWPWEPCTSMSISTLCHTILISLIGGNKHFIELHWIINIIYRDILWLKRSKSSDYVLNYVILITYFSYHYLM